MGDLQENLSGMCDAVIDLTKQLAGCGQSFSLKGESYRVTGVLGEGGFGIVYRVSGGSRGQKLAVKRIIAQSSDQLREAQWEIRVHKMLGNSNPNIMPLLADDIHPTRGGRDEVLMLYPLFGGGLVDLLVGKASRGEELPEAQALDLFSQCCAGVAAFHALNPKLAHRDIKPHNVLLSDDLSRAVLIDFGSSAPARAGTATRSERLKLKDTAAKHCSMAYRAPELWEPSEDTIIDERTDTWSLGCLLFCILFGQGYSPFECKFASNSQQGGPSPFGVAQQQSQSDSRLPSLLPRECTFLGTIGDVPFPVSHKRSPSLVQMIKWLLTKEPSARPTTEQILERLANLKESHAVAMC